MALSWDFFISVTSSTTRPGNWQEHLEGTKGATTRRASLNRNNLSRSVVRPITFPNFIEKLQGVVPVTTMSCSFQEACAMAPSSCAPMDAASLREISVMVEMIVETGRMRGTVM